MPKIDADTDMKAYLDQLPRHLTYSQMAEACLRRFGQRRAWSRTKIEQYWAMLHPPCNKPLSRIAADHEVRDFIDDRLGRLTLDMIVVSCRGQFGVERTPSRAAIHRYWQRSRQQNASREIPFLPG
jgi:hypothetical protein